MKNKLKIVAGYIKRLYIINDDVEYLYNKLYSMSTSEKNIKSILENFYNEYNTKIEVDIDTFIKTVNRIYEDISDNLNEELLNKKQVARSFGNEYRIKDKHNFEKMTYPLFLFINNLYFKLLKNNCERVFFFAREGQFLKKLFDKYQEAIEGPKIKTEYLYVSRASTFLGTLKSLDEENFDALFVQYPHMSIDTFCKNLGFSEEEIIKIIDIVKVNIFEIIYDLKDKEVFKKLTANEYFIKLYEEKRQKSKENFLKYLDGFKILNEKELHIVDVGWKGSIQNNLQKCIPHIKVHGYYVGLVHYGEVFDYEKKEAVLFEYTAHKISNNGYLYNSNRPFFEIFLDADHGSTVNYVTKNGKTEPVLNELEKEQIMYNNHIKPIQSAIYNKFEKLLNILKYGYYDIETIEKMFNLKFFELNFVSSKSELEEFNALYHYENFGVMNYSTFKRNTKLNIKQKIKAYLRFHRFIQNDETWQCLKLYNSNMYLGRLMLIIYKKMRLKKNNVI
ncbi:MAG: hypothetical protein IKU48_05820 [Clostridia bacterium]|nr:hypothetical protein [Clostridia bacterium]